MQVKVPSVQMQCKADYMRERFHLSSRVCDVRTRNRHRLAAVGGSITQAYRNVILMRCVCVCVDARIIPRGARITIELCQTLCGSLIEYETHTNRYKRYMFAGTTGINHV